jgi:hypothetical protein
MFRRYFVDTRGKGAIMDSESGIVNEGQRRYREVEADPRIEVYFDSLTDPKANWCCRYVIDMSECKETNDGLRSLYAYAKATIQAYADPEVIELIKEHPAFKLEVVHKHGGWGWTTMAEFE